MAKSFDGYFGSLTSRRSTCGWITCSLLGCCGVVACATHSIGARARQARVRVRAVRRMVLLGSEEERQTDGLGPELAGAGVDDEGGVQRVVCAQDEAISEVKPRT